ncbi:uncharacterized protein [Watersipora subatra]|uniref:uncharacterized protein n=1 Tax=Watersipora subatra TaxID=2589382 RepID=UPI00355BDCCA
MKEQSFADSYINFVRVSLAVAIIKNKPSNLKDGEAYALLLSGHAKDEQNDWKREYNILKHELLCLKQAQLVKEMKADGGHKIDSVLTPPLTLESQHLDSPNDDDHQALSLSKMTSHSVFLNKIAAMKDLTSGSLVILNSAALPTVVETFCDSLDSVKHSLLSMEMASSEMRDTRAQLIRCLVDLLNLSAGISTCQQVNKDICSFQEACVEMILSTQAGNFETISQTLKCLSRHPPCAFSLSQMILKRIVGLTKQLVTASFSSLMRNHSFLTQLENVPKVTTVFLSAHSLRVQSANCAKLQPCLTLLDLMTLRDDLDKTLSKYPLYTVHIREILTKTGHLLPNDGGWLDAE